MNNGVANQATRCFRRICDAFTKRARVANPNLEVTFRHVQPRNLNELPDLDTDIVLSSGGPGAPTDGLDEPWGVGYRKFLDDVHAAHTKRARAPKVLLVCHSFEIGSLHFGVAEVQRRETLKFGVMPAYMTADGKNADFLQPFGYRLFTWEHRNYEAVRVNEKRLQELGGKVLARESHPNAVVNRGDAVVGLSFGGGIDGVQFHPEADKAGVLNWIEKPEHKTALANAYGENLYDKMTNSLTRPDRLARTFALLIPGWLGSRFNELADTRGWAKVGEPEFDMQEFDIAV